MAEDGTTFTEFLTGHDGGSGDAEAARQLRELAAAVGITGKKGTVTVTVMLEPMSSNGALVASVAVTSKVPQEPPPAGIYFADSRGNLHADDPGQPGLELETVPAEIPLRRVDPGF